VSFNTWYKLPYRKKEAEMKTAGYWVDLFGITMSNEGTTWIQAMPLGTYQHPIHGTIDITTDRVQRFAANVNANVRGQDLDIDYDHKDKSGEAAGWVRKAEARSDGLWLAVEWTKAAAQKIKDKAYRYFSPEFVDEWKHPKSEQMFQDVLFGGGITNRPFLKDILPINMSELLAEPKPTGGTSMDPKLLRELLGLREDATDADVTAAIKKLRETPAPPTPPTDEALKQLAESNPVIKQLMETQALQAKQLAETQTALRLSEITTGIASLSTGKDWAFPAVMLNELPAAMVQMPKTLSDKLIEILGKVAETGLVQLKEKGRTRPGKGESDSDAVKTFTDKIAKAMTDLKMDYADAVSHISLTEPDSFEAYRQASFAGREN
jgi:phage I-like protein